MGCICIYTIFLNLFVVFILSVFFNVFYTFNSVMLYPYSMYGVSMEYLWSIYGVSMGVYWFSIQNTSYLRISLELTILGLLTIF